MFHLFELHPTQFVVGLAVVCLSIVIFCVLMTLDIRARRQSAKPPPLVAPYPTPRKEEDEDL